MIRTPLKARLKERLAEATEDFKKTFGTIAAILRKTAHWERIGV